ncbi:amino acid dehydrogenase [Sphingopyxis bauzanensis]|uniref:Amino acid dehydrogenase n=1 Tax=Sphingopyxis bauzanensis TaxID=651663 RepID=A0A246K111_9SPHN|nr:Glu/Leu/Phe/Val dehydrogenase dimerization domain-containing protein [Sphingopyxis bauzanensis]OWQ99189.1 amino acid dehydrogenase [Sphingopyxis bauzanensis]GGJ44762.1 leucine dehydrogenase [Sphingopyxis bauzanensis]
MVVQFSGRLPALETVRLEDKSAGLDGIIVVHSTTLGPGAGGCRLWHYPDLDQAFTDAFRLAEGMSYKNAMAGLPFGGAKAVLRRPDGPFDRAALFQAFGRAVAALGGRYVTAEDVGTTVADMQEVARETRHVAGLAAVGAAAGGDPSPWTAQGVFGAIEASAAFALGSDLKGLTVAVQGTGSVGGELCRRLADAGARLVIADVAPGRRDRLATILGARVVSADAIASVEADVFVPCALGGVLDKPTVAAMKAKLVCGGANNQLATPEIAGMLREHGITYVPDYVANAGGIISVSAEYLGESAASVASRVAQIGPRVTAILEEAARRDISPATAADETAERLIASAGRLAA